MYDFFYTKYLKRSKNFATVFTACVISFSGKNMKNYNSHDNYKKSFLTQINSSARVILLPIVYGDGVPLDNP